jgi:60 kDa SS-A/Ro ribonucleoprotein
MVSTILRQTAPPVERNYAGGETFRVGDWEQLNRFLTIGVVGGTYYVGEKQHVMQNVEVLDRLLDADPQRFVNAVVQVSDAGRAPKNDFAIYALAKAAAHPKAAAHALANLSAVCRTGTHLFQFVAAVDTMRGWGPALRKAISRWYLSKSADKLAYQILKYQQREGWSHRDVLRKAHPDTDDPRKNAVLRWAVKGPEGVQDAFALPDIIIAQNTVQQYVDPEIAADHIRRFNLSREMIPTELLNEPKVLVALAETMPYTALMRNLGNLTRHGVLKEVDVVTRLQDPELIQKSRVHPINVLTALRTYASGQGFRGSGLWTPEPEVTHALEQAFYASFKNVEPTGRRFLVGLDVSGSMTSRWGDGVLSAAEIAAALTMMLKRTEPDVTTMAFARSFVHLPLSAEDRLEDVLARTRNMTFGTTDCAQPMIYAMEKGLAVDCFVVITDNETWAGRIRADKALKDYRKKTGIDAKLIVLATASTPFSIADPKDRGMLDIAGFDSSVPEVIRLFVEGSI